VLGFINTKQNNIFTVLTIVSVVGIPPTLVASIYGMNFKNMPELDWAWGYEFGLALILERFPLRLNRDSQSGRKGGVSGRDSPSGGCPYGQAVFVGFAFARG
ncbi:MAG: CorA family divalent cation transporter, partial [Pseudolabrys sp.]